MSDESVPPFADGAGELPPPPEQVPADEVSEREAGQGLAADAGALIGRAESQLFAIEAAIAELEAGTYGRCEICGEAIEADRLAARASERRCLIHADARLGEPRLF